MENVVEHFVNIHWLCRRMINENMQVIMNKKYSVNHPDVIDRFVRYRNVLDNCILQNVLQNNQEEGE